MIAVADFLLELLCEEIPARMQAKASDDLARLFAEQLAQAGLKTERITSYVTPRRLALIAHGLPVQTEAVSEEFKGPRTSAPDQALEGFLRKTGLVKDQLEDRDGVWFATVEKPGRATAEVLAEAIPAIIRAFPWPKSMRWGVASASTEMTRWVRPLQGIVALLGNNIVTCDVAGVLSGRQTMGHRFHSRVPVTVESAATYTEQLRAAYVIVDQAERQAIIADRAKALAEQAGYALIEDTGLVAENAGLTEWPAPLLGHFDPEFLEVPPEVIQLTLRINQKYFVLRDGEGKLAPAFICTANIEAKDGGTAIVAGNGKVLAARLSDARFFWEQDKKTRLEDHAKKLSRITFHEKLGTVADKVERVAKLARWLVEQGIVQPSVTPDLIRGPASGVTKEEMADLAEQAAKLCKADLVTEMVGEFPELQGLMGGYYARAEGLPDAVADAIRDHYKPVGQGDDVPTAPVTVAVSLADKLDTIFGFFLIDEKPTGSKDPFALRRASLGLIRLIIEKQSPTSLFHSFKGLHLVFWKFFLDSAVALDPNFKAVSKHFGNAADRETILAQILNEFEQAKGNKLDWKLTGNPKALDFLHLAQKIDANGPEVLADIFLFIQDRLKVQQKEAGVRHDLIDAVFALGGEDDLVRLLARVRALQGFIETPDGANLLAGYKRAANILKKEGYDDPSSRHPDLEPQASTASEPAEIALGEALDAAEPKAAQAVADERFEDAMSALALLRAPIDAFFESVIVNDPDPAKRAARLALLHRVRAAVHKVADFSKIAG